MKTFLEKIRNKYNLPIILFFLMLLNYIPIIAPNIFTKESKAANIIFMITSFAIQIAVLILCFYKNINITKEKIINFKIVTWLSVILIVAQVFRFFFDDFKILDIANIVCQFLNIVFLFICMLDVRVSEDNIEKFMKFVVIWGIIACVFNICLYFKEILKIILGNVTYVSIKSFFANRNQFAFFLYVAITSNIFLILKNNQKRYKVILTIFLINLFFTMSRTGIALTIMFLAILIFVFNKLELKKKMLYLTLFIIFVMIFLMSFYFLNPKFVNQIIRLDSVKNLSGRTEIWEKGIEILTESPLNLLVGIGRFNASEELVLKEKSFTQFHNIYLDFLVTGGILELGFAIYIFYVVVKSINFSNLNEKYKKFYNCVFITYFIYALFESVGRFSIGAVDVLCFIYFITMPLLHSINYSKENLYN